MAGAVLNDFVVGAPSHAIRMQTKLSRIFSAPFGSFLHSFAKACVSRTLHDFGDFTFDILLSVLDVVNFFVFVTLIKVQYLALFVVGAAFLRPSRCTQTSRIFFSAPCGSFLQSFVKPGLWAELCMFFGWFHLWYFAHCAWCFWFIVFNFLWEGYLTKRVFVY